MGSPGYVRLEAKGAFSESRSRIPLKHWTPWALCSALLGIFVFGTLFGVAEPDGPGLRGLGAANLAELQRHSSTSGFRRHGLSWWPTSFPPGPPRPLVSVSHFQGFSGRMSSASLYQEALPRPACNNQWSLFKYGVRCKAEPEENVDSAVAKPSLAQISENATAALGPREDDILPDNLKDSLDQSGRASARALEDGVRRQVVELFVPELFDPLSGAIMGEEGDQLKYWKMTRIFSQTLAEASGKKLRVIYPDAGTAALLKSKWGAEDFKFGSLNDRKPYDETEDEVVVIACADPQGVGDMIKTTKKLDGVLPVVLFNPRLASGDVGVGLAVRRMRKEFMGSCKTVYSLTPMSDGAVYLSYPELWKTFASDETAPGRFKLISVTDYKPKGEALEEMVEKALPPPSQRVPQSFITGEEEIKYGFLDEVAAAEGEKVFKDLGKFFREVKRAFEGI